jgi:hypothetical protein
MIKVYTAITGGYEKDRKDIEVYIKEIMVDPKKSSLFYKSLTPDFDKYEYSIWMDGNTKLKVAPEYLIEKYLQNDYVAVLRHPDRNCIYDEAATCKTLNLDDLDTIEEQMIRYKERGYPENNGLSCTTYILRKHTPEIKRFNEKWWAEICEGSRRDQLSFDYCLWELGIKVKWFDVYHFDSHKINDYFDYTNHHNDISRFKISA